LQQDLVNYAVLVFDLNPDRALLEGYDLSNTKLYFSSVNLKAQKLIEIQPNNTKTIIKNYIKSVK